MEIGGRKGELEDWMAGVLLCAIRIRNRCSVVVWIRRGQVFAQ